MKGRPVVLGYYFNSEERALRVNALPEPVMPRGAFDGKNVAFVRWVGYTGNLPVYQRSAVGAGHFNPEPDFDGVLRRVPMLAEFDGAYYESLSLAMVRAYLRLTSGQAPAVAAGYPPQRPNDLEWLDVGGVTFPVDESASALVPYRGGKGSFPYHSLVDVLKDPAAQIEALCDALRIPYLREMLAWPAGRRDTDGAWAPHWYAAVEASTGFEPYRRRTVELDDTAQRLVDECRPWYEKLYALRLKA
jgi:adenylate cyclase